MSASSHRWNSGLLVQGRQPRLHFDPVSKQPRSLLPLYPRMLLLPNGNVFYTGQGRRWKFGIFLDIRPPGWDMDAVGGNHR
jgi:hypothetical protein